MKKILIAAFIVCLATSCKKSDEKSSKSNTTTSKCYLTNIYSYDKDGNQTGSQQNFYTGNQLDSSCSINASGKITGTARYIYISSTERRVEYYNYISGLSSKGGEETINSKGDVIEGRSYDANHNLTSKYVYTYKCN